MCQKLYFTKSKTRILCGLVKLRGGGLCPRAGGCANSTRPSPGLLNPHCLPPSVRPHCGVWTAPEHCWSPRLRSLISKNQLRFPGWQHFIPMLEWYQCRFFWQLRWTKQFLGYSMNLFSNNHVPNSILLLMLKLEHFNFQYYPGYSILLHCLLFTNG